MSSHKSDYAEWVGRRETVHDRVDGKTVAGMAAFMDMAAPPQDGDPIPNGWHWMYFAPPVPQRMIGGDGHPKRGNFMPPVTLPYRMFAGAEVDFLAPLHVGDVISCEREITSVAAKKGRSGPLVFVDIQDDITRDDQLLVRQKRSIVYREATRSEAKGGEENAPDECDWKDLVHPDAVMLFKFSALTSNSHRIHYDRTYATNEEHYPGLVVHGPLIALHMLAACERANDDQPVSTFSFRAVSPLFDTGSFSVAGRKETKRRAELWAADSTGRLAMTGQASFA